MASDISSVWELIEKGNSAYKCYRPRNRRQAT
jgi:hypothetical protein